MSTLVYYKLGLKVLKSFIKKSVVETVLGRSHRYPLNMPRCTVTWPYSRRRRYLSLCAWEHRDVDIMKKGGDTLKKLASEKMNQECGKTSEASQFHYERNPIKKLHCIFLYLSDRCHTKRKYWKRNLATVLSRLLEFPGYVCARFNVAKNGGKEIEKKINNPNLDVTVIVPAYNEEKEIERVLGSIFDQTEPPKKVIVVDDCSEDNTQKICKELEKKYRNLVYIRQIRRRGKAHNLNVAIQLILKRRELYSPITLVIDASGFLEKDFMEKIKSSFNEEDVAAASCSAAVIKPESLKGKVIFEKYELMFKVYKFRKGAQNYRNTVSPVCGGCVAYRTEILKDLPIPERTRTEDTDHTWLLLEKGYRVVHNPKAIKHCVEAKTFRGFFKQWYRWYAGTFQCLYAHGQCLLKAKKLLFSTVLPGMIDGLSYSTVLLIAIAEWLGALYLPFKQWHSWYSVLTFKLLLWDFGITGLMMTIIRRHELKSLKYLPIVWLMKFPLILIWFVAGLRTTWQYLVHKQYAWRFSARSWKRPDATVGNQRKMDICELALGLTDLREEIAMLKSERANLLAEKDRLEKAHGITAKV